MLAGILVTGLVQSSSAVTVATIARQPVDRILAGTPVEFISLGRYPQNLSDTRTPLIAFFYVNSDPARIQISDATFRM